MLTPEGVKAKTCSVTIVHEECHEKSQKLLETRLGIRPSEDTEMSLNLET